MNPLRSALRGYVAMRRGLGFKFQCQERRLKKFVKFMEERSATIITYKLAIEWATQPRDRHASWTLRLTDVRGFARHLCSIEARTEIPPVGVLPGLARSKPYLYTEAEIRKLLAAALTLRPIDGLRRWTYHNLFGLLAVTGLRISEALALRREDADLKKGILTIRSTKFGKSRLVPLHPTTRHSLVRYAKQRDLHLCPPRSPYFFVAEYGGQLSCKRSRPPWW